MESEETGLKSTTNNDPRLVCSRRLAPGSEADCGATLAHATRQRAMSLSPLTHLALLVWLRSSVRLRFRVRERERTSRPAAPSADNEAPGAQESNKVIGADTDKATGKQPESKKKETRKKKVLAEIGTRMEQQASESCKMSGGSSATRQQERIGRGSACPHFRGGLVVEGLVE